MRKNSFIHKCNEVEIDKKKENMEIENQKTENNSIINQKLNKFKKILLMEVTDEMNKKITSIFINVMMLFITINLINISQFYIAQSFIFNRWHTLKMGIPYGHSMFRTIIIESFSLYYWISALFIFLIFLFFYAIVNSRKISLLITNIMLFIYGSINYVVMIARGSGITIGDFLTINTGLDVSNNMKINFNLDYKIGVTLFIISILLTLISFRKKLKINWKTRTAILICTCVMMVGMTYSRIVQNAEIWNINDTYGKTGIITTTLKLITNFKVKKPDNYNKDNVEKIIEKYNADEMNEQEDINIIAIMNESFADYTQVGKIEMSKDNIPFFHELQKDKNSIGGFMHSGYYGGGTANVEYEFLTNNTVAFLPKGSIPYQQYVIKDTDSIANYLNDKGYETYAQHPCSKTNYERYKVYNYMGFETMKFLDDFNDLKYSINNKYTTDESIYKKIINQLENKDRKTLSFTVTMQNHFPYKTKKKDGEEYTKSDDVTVYMQQQNESDEALEHLIEYLKKYKEKVVLVFFGDHQPNLDSKVEFDEPLDKYKVPYLIWANYDWEKKEYGETSANYLQSILFEQANLPKTQYMNYLLDIRKQIPVITTNYYMGNNGQRYNINDVDSPYYEKIQEYRNIVYYQMFDNE